MANLAVAGTGSQTLADALQQEADVEMYNDFPEPIKITNDDKPAEGGCGC